MLIPCDVMTFGVYAAILAAVIMLIFGDWQLKILLILILGVAGLVVYQGLNADPSMPFLEDISPSGQNLALIVVIAAALILSYINSPFLALGLPGFVLFFGLAIGGSLWIGYSARACFPIG